MEFRKWVPQTILTVVLSLFLIGAWFNRNSFSIIGFIEIFVIFTLVTLLAEIIYLILLYKKTQLSVEFKKARAFFLYHFLLSFVSLTLLMIWL